MEMDQELRERIEKLREWVKEHREKKDVDEKYLEAAEEHICTLLEEGKNSDFSTDGDEEDIDPWEEYTFAAA